MAISVICIGKNKQDTIKDAIDDYLKRTRRFCDINLTVLPDIKLTKSITPQLVVEKESARIIDHLQPKQSKIGRYTVLLDRKGRSIDSLAFSKLIDKKGMSLNFIIGGVYGVNEQLQERVDLLLSMSQMTFTHQMSRVILLEQIYRSMTILNNKKYHY